MAYLIKTILEELKHYDIKFVNITEEFYIHADNDVYLIFDSICNSIEISKYSHSNFINDKSIEYYKLSPNLSLLKIIEIIWNVFNVDYLNSNKSKNSNLNIIAKINRFIIIDCKYSNITILYEENIEILNGHNSNPEIIMYEYAQDFNSIANKFLNFDNLVILYTI